MDSICTADSYFRLLGATLLGVASDKVDQIAEVLLEAYARDRAIFVFGNGGSATTASHFVCDLGKGTAKALAAEDRRFRVMGLTDNVATLTAWANDVAYESIFSEQLRNHLRPGDVVVAISGSGNSRNVLTALQFARSQGATCIGLTGFDGGDMVHLCDTCVVVPATSMEVIEDVHLALCHAVATVIRAALARREETLDPDWAVTWSKTATPSRLRRFPVVSENTGTHPLHTYVEGD